MEKLSSMMIGIIVYQLGCFIFLPDKILLHRVFSLFLLKFNSWIHINSKLSSLKYAKNDGWIFHIDNWNKYLLWYLSLCPSSYLVRLMIVDKNDRVICSYPRRWSWDTCNLGNIFCLNKNCWDFLFLYHSAWKIQNINQISFRKIKII